MLRPRLNHTSPSRTRLGTFLPVVLLAVAPALSGCFGDEPTVALLVADGTDTSAQPVDVQDFTDRVEATCDECRVRVYDAEGDADVQLSQVRQAEADSAEVVVVVPCRRRGPRRRVRRDAAVVSLGGLVSGSDRFVGLEDGALPQRSGSDLDAAREVAARRRGLVTFVPTRAMSEQAADVAVALLAARRCREAPGSTGSSRGLPVPGRHRRHADVGARRAGRGDPGRAVCRQCGASGVRGSG